MFLLLGTNLGCTVVDSELLELVLEIKNQNLELLEEVKSLQSKSDSLVNELKNSAAKQEEVLKKVTDLQAELVKVLAQIGTLNEQLGAQNADLDEIKSQLADLQEKYQGILEQLEQLQKLSQILAEIEKLKGQLAELDGKYQVIQGSLTQNKEQLDALKGQVASLQAQLAENLTKISQLTSQLGEQGADIEKILAAIEELKKSCAEIKALLENQLSGKSPVPTNGLVGWWPFNGNANDESGNGNNGIPFNANLEKGRDESDKGSYKFNGINSYISLPKQINDGKTLSEFTISVWIKKFSSKPGIIWSKSGFWKEIVLSSNASDITSFFYAYPSPQAYYGITDSKKLELNKWNFIVITQSDGILKIYINGELSKTNPGNSLVNWSQDTNGCSTGQNFIGMGRYCEVSNVEPWDGLLDELGFWNRALTADEISKIYKGEGF